MAPYESALLDFYKPLRSDIFKHTIISTPPFQMEPWCFFFIGFPQNVAGQKHIIF